jgi:hypothetical protein
MSACYAIALRAFLGVATLPSLNAQVESINPDSSNLLLRKNEHPELFCSMPAAASQARSKTLSGPQVSPNSCAMQNVEEDLRQHRATSTDVFRIDRHHDVAIVG